MRGGKRPGAGRPRTEGERKSLSFRLPLDCIEILDKKAEECQRSRTDFLIKLLRETKK